MISKQFSIEINREKLSEQNDSNIIPSLAQFSSVVQLCLTLCDPHGLYHARFPYHQFPSLLNLMSIKWVMPSNHLILCHPLLLPPSIFPGIRVFSSESFFCIRWPKY